jgi:hypothetical protein
MKKRKRMHKEADVLGTSYAKRHRRESGFFPAARAANAPHLIQQSKHEVNLTLSLFDFPTIGRKVFESADNTLSKHIFEETKPP